MKLKLLNKQELTDLYEAEMVFDFPKAELKPLRAMHHLMDRGQYDPLLVTDDGGEALGYAMMWLPRARDGALLEYLGVLRGKRSGGIGSQVIPLLAHRYGQLFGEAEAPDSDDRVENDLRRRRIAFYERNGFRVLDYDTALFGVHFKSLYLGPETDDRKVEVLHRSVYADYFSPRHMERYIQLPLGPGEAIHPAPAWLEEDEEETLIELEREDKLRAWFNMWLRQVDEGIGELFASDGVYIESWGPEYHGADAIRHWFAEWNGRGRVVAWDIKQFFHKGDQTVVEWYFKNAMDDGRVEEFDGLSLVRWNGDGKIDRLQEFGCNLNRYDPYAHGPAPQFRDEKAAWF